MSHAHLDRYVPNGTPLTPHEREILTILMEEAAEVILAASKLIRFGKENRPADGSNAGEANTRTLGLEVGDLRCMIARVALLQLTTSGDVSEGFQRKGERLLKYLQTDPP